MTLPASSMISAGWLAPARGAAPSGLRARARLQNPGASLIKSVPVNLRISDSESHEPCSETGGQWAQVPAIPAVRQPGGGPQRAPELGSRVKFAAPGLKNSAILNI